MGGTGAGEKLAQRMQRPTMTAVAAAGNGHRCGSSSAAESVVLAVACARTWTLSVEPGRFALVCEAVRAPAPPASPPPCGVLRRFGPPGGLGAGWKPALLPAALPYGVLHPVQLPRGAGEG